MTRLSDLPEEEQAASRARAHAAIARADATLDSLSERAAQRWADGSASWERAAEQRQEDEKWERLRQPQVLGRNWEAEQRWVEQIIDQRVGKAAIEATGIALAQVRKQLRDEVAALAEEIGKDIAGLEKRIKEQEAATVELLLEAEKRIAALERRLADTKPRLIAAGGSDAAA